MPSGTELVEGRGNKLLGLANKLPLAVFEHFTQPEGLGSVVIRSRSLSRKSIYRSQSSRRLAGLANRPVSSKPLEGSGRLAEDRQGLRRGAKSARCSGSSPKQGEVLPRNLPTRGRIVSRTGECRWQPRGGVAKSDSKANRLKAPNRPRS